MSNENTQVCPIYEFAKNGDENLHLMSFEEANAKFEIDFLETAPSTLDMAIQKKPAQYRLAKAISLISKYRLLDAADDIYGILIHEDNGKITPYGTRAFITAYFMACIATNIMLED